MTELGTWKVRRVSYSNISFTRDQRVGLSSSDSDVRVVFITQTQIWNQRHSPCTNTHPSPTLSSGFASLYHMYGVSCSLRVSLIIDNNTASSAALSIEYREKRLGSMSTL